MSEFLQCSERNQPCYKDDGWMICACDGCTAFRNRMKNHLTPYTNSSYEAPPKATKSISDGSTASYYELPSWARELADLIRYKRMNGSQAEMFRALYRGSEASHSDEKRQAKKLLAYAVDEVVRTHFPEESFAPYRTAVFDAIFGGSR